MIRSVFAVLFIINLSDAAHAEALKSDEEVKRLSGFAQHKAENKIFDREREQGKVGWLEELEQWERERQAALLEHKKQKKNQSPQENGPEYKEEVKFKKSLQQDYDMATKEFLSEKSFNFKNRKKYAFSEEEELDLYLNRPRYDFKKRMSSGKGKINTQRGSGSGSSGSFGGGESFPAPPSFDNFGGDGYVPPPVMPEEEFSPPPPPPPNFDSGDFPPPPPPPPPPWDGETGF